MANSINYRIKKIDHSSLAYYKVKSATGQGFDLQKYVIELQSKWCLHSWHEDIYNDRDETKSEKAILSRFCPISIIINLTMAFIIPTFAHDSALNMWNAGVTYFCVVRRVAWRKFFLRYSADRSPIPLGSYDGKQKITSDRPSFGTCRSSLDLSFIILTYH